MNNARKRRFFDPTYLPREKRQAAILACMLFWSVLSFILISRFVVGGAAVVGNSMAPTLADGDRVILNRWVYRLGPPRRGDVVALDVPGFEGHSIKRVIALPGERVQLRDNAVFVNGRPLEEPYLTNTVRTFPGALSTNLYEVAPDCYFVLGDNREASTDSRVFGAVPALWIIGRAEGSGYAQYKY